MPNYPVTLTTDTSQYADGDLLADTQLVSADVGRAGKIPVLDSIRVEDDDDQGIAFDLVFLIASTSMGTENGAPNMSDADIAAAVIAVVPIVAGDFKDLGGARVASKYNLGLTLFVPDKGSLYVAAVSRGTGTYTATGLKLSLGVNYR